MTNERTIEELKAMTKKNRKRRVTLIFEDSVLENGTDSLKVYLGGDCERIGVTNFVDLTPPESWALQMFTLVKRAIELNRSGKLPEKPKDAISLVK